MAVDPIRGAGGLQTEVAGRRTSELFERHGRMIYGLCRALLRDPDDADDATQATFISAYRSLLAGTAVREPTAWLATIARNECAARAQARMREPLPLHDTDVTLATGPEDELERKALARELRSAIAALPEKQREAVVLRDLYGLPYNEVGAALGMSVAAVESLLFRARRSLRVSLKPAAGGALAVPLAVREGIAQALPAFSTTGGGAGGTVSGGLGLGLLAKFTGGPLAVKLATGVVALTAAGSMVALESERSLESADRGHVRGGSTAVALASGGVPPAFEENPTPTAAFARRGGERGADAAEQGARAGSGRRIDGGTGGGERSASEESDTHDGGGGVGSDSRGGDALEAESGDSSAEARRSSDDDSPVREPAELDGRSSLIRSVSGSGGRPLESDGNPDHEGSRAPGTSSGDSGSDSSGEPGTSDSESGSETSSGDRGSSGSTPDQGDTPVDPDD